MFKTKPAIHKFSFQTIRFYAVLLALIYFFTEHLKVYYFYDGWVYGIVLLSCAYIVSRNLSKKNDNKLLYGFYRTSEYVVALIAEGMVLYFCHKGFIRVDKVPVLITIIPCVFIVARGYLEGNRRIGGFQP